MMGVSKSGGFFVPKTPQLDVVRRNVKVAVLDFIRDYTRTRIKVFGQGADEVPLLGYSESPVVIDYPGKPKRKVAPRGGAKVHGGMFFFGGYKQYRQKAGLVADRFVFDNTGDAWLDWKILQYGSLADVGQIGFSNDDNAMAATAAESKRPLMFVVTANELAAVHSKVEHILTTKLFSK